MRVLDEGRPASTSGRSIQRWAPVLVVEKTKLFAEALISEAELEKSRAVVLVRRQGRPTICRASVGQKPQQRRACPNVGTATSVEAPAPDPFPERTWYHEQLCVQMGRCKRRVRARQRRNEGVGERDGSPALVASGENVEQSASASTSANVPVTRWSSPTRHATKTCVSPRLAGTVARSTAMEARYSVYLGACCRKYSTMTWYKVEKWKRKVQVSHLLPHVSVRR